MKFMGILRTCIANDNDSAVVYQNMHNRNTELQWSAYEFIQIYTILSPIILSMHSTAGIKMLQQATVYS